MAAAVSSAAAEDEAVGTALPAVAIAAAEEGVGGLALAE